MRFFISCYGNRYVPLLSVCLSSLLEKHPFDIIDVYIYDLKEHEILFLRNSFPLVNFEVKSTTAAHFDNPIQSIPAKLEHWCAYLDALENNVLVSFLDADLLIHENLASSIPKEFDFLYTWKDEKYPLNTGVVIVRNSPAIRSFMAHWYEKTKCLIYDQAQLQDACAKNGAADQHALYQIMGFVNGECPTAGRWSKAFPFGDIRFYGATCRELNQTNSVPVSSGARVFHYKAGWHSILLEGGPYTEHRSRQSSFEMHEYWESIYQIHNTKMLKSLILSIVREAQSSYGLYSESFEKRGILHSEMLCVLALTDALEIDVLIESGRARGQSTFILSRYLSPSRAKIHSIEYVRDKDTEFAEQRLSQFPNLELHYGDSNELLPELLGNYQGQKVALLIDGPKGRDAFDLLSRCIARFDNVVVAFIHDLRKLDFGKPLEQRYLIHQYFDRVFFTDDDDYVDLTRGLDEQISTSLIDTDQDSWRPYYKGWQYIESYGPTLAVIFPTDRDRIRAQKASNHPEQTRPRFFQRVVRRIKVIMGQV